MIKDKDLKEFQKAIGNVNFCIIHYAVEDGGKLKYKYHTAIRPNIITESFLNEEAMVLESISTESGVIYRGIVSITNS